MERSDCRIDLSLDYHAHILPACDHGSDGLETSLRQIAMAREAGIRTICATPHFYPHKESAESFLARRSAAAEQLTGRLPEGSPAVELGAEVLICDGIDRLDELPALCRAGTRELLLEMPFYDWPAPIWDTLFRLNELPELQIVIAHADRYPVSDIETLIAEHIPLQLNVDCLTRPLRRRRYLSWIEAGAVQYLGSDIHMLGPGYRDWVKCRALLKKLR